MRLKTCKFKDIAIVRNKIILIGEIRSITRKKLNFFNLFAENNLLKSAKTQIFLMYSAAFLAYGHKRL